MLGSLRMVKLINVAISSHENFWIPPLWLVVSTRSSILDIPSEFAAMACTQCMCLKTFVLFWPENAIETVRTASRFNYITFLWMLILVGDCWAQTYSSFFILLSLFFSLADSKPSISINVTYFNESFSYFYNNKFQLITSFFVYHSLKLQKLLFQMVSVFFLSFSSTEWIQCIHLAPFVS